MKGSVLVGFIALVASAPAAAQWAANAQSLYTEDGVEIGIDPRVAAVFAMLNALGYDDDSRRGPLPLRRPQYAPARIKARNSLGRPGGGIKALEQAVNKNPVQPGAYAAAALELGAAPNFEAPKDASPLAKAIAPALREWFNEEGGNGVVRLIGEEARPAQKKLLPAIDKAVKATTSLVKLGEKEDQLLDDSGAVGRVVLVLNEMDSHSTIQRVQRGDVTYVVAGPPAAQADEDAIANAVVAAYARTLVVREAGKAAKPGTLVDVRGKLQNGGKDAFADDKSFASELLACAFMQKVRGKVSCTASPLANEPAAQEALAVLAPRIDQFASDKAVLAAAVEKLLEAPPAPVAAPTEPAPPPDDGKKKGKGK